MLPVFIFNCLICFYYNSRTKAQSAMQWSPVVLGEDAATEG
ncbi:hypothetical protein PORCRE_406 [Porphyromonas crevioricanis JCM 15906]|uniref:Uncharacterized protein n=1 Tax=Porphyromonas crevioricanis JCM 15906 TaxID=1305617 RepID=S4N9E3_9PORP|nr:hypothetical protein PORCRE_406 [Porphyromonas crevioricanis JCM 15906]GAD08046.1 hypothetical protein PORCAN_1679 [Porphyromonas crevioricanis JCM 13913]